MIPVYIGYDAEVEPVAYHVCAGTIIRYCSEPVRITPLHLGNFRKFYEETHKDGSNDFIYSRFLVPYLETWRGHAIFMDGDMILREGVDLAELWEMRSYNKAVQVVQHPEYATKYPKKYMGARNENYPRKNWSSVILWNCGHFANRVLTPEFVAKQPGSFLHRFSWVPEDKLGSLPAEWNRLVLEQPITADDKLLHYTVGTPCFEDYSKCPGADEWYRAADLEFGNKEPAYASGR